ncbi:unnamed protein product [Rhodiola kirilowii]
MDSCPSLQEDEVGDVNQYYRPSYRQQQGGYNGQMQYQQRGQNYNQASPNNQGSSKSLEDIVKELATTMHQNQAKTDGAISELSKQMSQIATTVSELKMIQEGSRRRPFQTRGAMSMQ